MRNIYCLFLDNLGRISDGKQDVPYERRVVDRGKVRYEQRYVHVFIW